MGQIHGANLGSPVAIVTALGELTTTGSVFKTTVAQDQDTIIARDNNQILVELLKEAKKINFQLMVMTNNQIKNQDIEV